MNMLNDCHFQMKVFNLNKTSENVSNECIDLLGLSTGANELRLAKATLVKLVVVVH